MAKVHIEDRIVNYVRNAIDISVEDSGYPVVSWVLTQAGIATREQLRHLETKGHIKSIDVEAPSSLVPGSTTVYKAYYTERNVPAYVTEQEASTPTD